MKQLLDLIRKVEDLKTKHFTYTLSKDNNKIIYNNAQIEILEELINNKEIELNNLKSKLEIMIENADRMLQDHIDNEMIIKIQGAKDIIVWVLNDKGIFFELEKERNKLKDFLKHEKNTD